MREIIDYKNSCEDFSQEKNIHFLEREKVFLEDQEEKEWFDQIHKEIVFETSYYHANNIKNEGEAW